MTTMNLLEAPKSPDAFGTSPLPRQPYMGGLQNSYWGPHYEGILLLGSKLAVPDYRKPRYPQTANSLHHKLRARTPKPINPAS